MISSLDCTSILQLCENSIGKTTSCVNSDDMHQDSNVNQYCSPSVRECSVQCARTRNPDNCNHNVL